MHASGVTSEISVSPPPLLKHQERDVQFSLNTPIVFNTSDPGTGKTRTTIETVIRRADPGRVLVLCPKSIMQPAWGNDLEKFSNFTYAIASADKRQKAFDADVQWVITNHDATGWIYDNPKILRGFSTLIIDESTAYKNFKAERSKAARSIAPAFKYRTCMSGTPNPNGILDLWHQVFLLDGGQRLNNSYWHFRSVTCEPKGFGQFVKWEPKQGIEQIIAGLISDITIRNKMEDCIDIPPNHTYRVPFKLSPTHWRVYDEFRKKAILHLENTAQISAVNAAVELNKLLQIASGAVYDDARCTQTLDKERCNLVMDLAEERNQCVVAFLWQHQKQQLIEAATKRKFSFAVIDGETPLKKREEAVAAFQSGNIKLILAHPQSAGHGLTLTKGTTTIWCSPTFNLEWFDQFKRRIYRYSQTEKTETILIEGQGTVDHEVYDRLEGKNIKLQNLLEFLT